jgi:hypothetical protein
VGEHKDSKDLYPDGTWSWWDWEAKEELTLATWNTLTEDGEKMRAWLLGESTPKPASVKSEPKAGVAEPKRSTELTPKADPIVPKEAQQARKLMNSLGETLYASKWETYRHKTAADYGRKREVPVNITSSNDLTLGELRLFIMRLEKAARTKVQEIANEHDLDIEYSDYDNGATMLEDLSGFALYKLLKELMEIETEA